MPLATIHCRTESVNYVLARLRPESVVGKSLRIRNALQMLQVLQRSNLEVKVFLPAGSYLLPFSWCLMLCHWNKITFSRKTFAMFAEQFNNVGYIYHLTAAQLYGIAQAWTHCVSEVFIDGKRELFDSLAPEDREISSSMKRPQPHRTLISHWGIITCVGDQKKV